MIRKVKIGDSEYPKNLKNIHKPPQALYVNGRIFPEDAMAIALVGSRRASNYGLEACEEMAFELASFGVTVVSGMARGIDSAAHRGAIKAKGRTIAVMGSGHNHIYPPENEKLYSEIAANGAVITEFGNAMQPLPENFPRRNRIISGLSLGVVVVEAARNSGALITANFALEQGREVFAVPGKISSHTSSGANELIKDGAKLVQSVEDVLEELEVRRIEAGLEHRAQSTENREKIKIMTRAYIYNSLTEKERKIYSTLSDEPLGIDDICNNTGGMRPEDVSAVLVKLELKKAITRLPGDNYVKKA